jgi:hypothetical protein
LNRWSLDDLLLRCILKRDEDVPSNVEMSRDQHTRVGDWISTSIESIKYFTLDLISICSEVAPSSLPT